MDGRVMAIDPGEKRIGISLSDLTATLAAPFAVIRHVAMAEDCQKIVEIAKQNQVTVIVIGQALGGEGESTPQSRHSQKMAEVIRRLVDIPVVLWDESGSTRDAQKIARRNLANRNARSGHLDDHAAAVLLQDYLDAVALKDMA